jgi:glycosyltransferase involved in cell wall biosynthesis
MAHIFKKYNKNNNQKGIFVITHKEIGMFESLPKKIKDYYYMGVHYGSASHLQGATKMHIQDFSMGRESTVKFIDKEPFRIPYNSRAFTPEYYKENPEIPKYWDIINVSRNAHVKRLDTFLHSIRKLYDSGNKYKVLLVVPSSTNEQPDTHLVDIIKMYQQMFTRKEREFFTLMRLSSELGFLGISPRTIAYFYQSSKIFCLLSSAEGESRVIHEALLCGLPVVCYAGLLGGGRDYLNETNSVQFRDYNHIHNSFIKAISGYDKLKVESDFLSEELREDRTLPKLKKYFSDLYKENSDTFDNNLINVDELSLRLPAHYLDLPWNTEHGNGQTADICSKEQMRIFMGELMK